MQLFYKAYGSRAKTSSCLTDHSWRQDIRPTQQPSGAKQTEYEELRWALGDSEGTLSQSQWSLDGVNGQLIPGHWCRCVAHLPQHSAETICWRDTGGVWCSTHNLHSRAHSSIGSDESVREVWQLLWYTSPLCGTWKQSKTTVFHTRRVQWPLFHILSHISKTLQVVDTSYISKWSPRFAV